MAITVDGPNKLFILSSGTVTLDVKDLFSRWKDWVLLTDNSKYLPAFDSVGGQDIDVGAGTSIPAYLFLINGWKVRPQEASHTLAVTNGILLVSGGGDPFVNTTGSYVVRINYQQPVQAITVATGAGPTAADIWQHVIEAGFSAEELMRLLAAAMGGKVSGAETTTITFRDTDDSKDRIVATVDTDGNRTAVTYDLS